MEERGSHPKESKKEMEPVIKYAPRKPTTKNFSTAETESDSSQLSVVSKLTGGQNLSRSGQTAGQRSEQEQVWILDYDYDSFTKKY